jgi:SAM-dependent methyltransferase
MPASNDNRLDALREIEGISGVPVYRLALKLCREVDLGNDLLDFGAGTGNLLRELPGVGYRGQLTGTDIKARPASLPESVKWVQADLNQPLPLANKSFSAILSTEVMTGLENPRFVFREFARLLRPGGMLLVTNPNQESLRSLSALVLGGHFAAFRKEAYPAAITALLRQDWEHLCAESGFAPPQFFYTDAGGLPRVPQVTWQYASFDLLKGRLFSDNLALLTRKV